MPQTVRRVQLFSWLIVQQFIAVTTHDWIDVPGWTTGSQVQEVVGRRKLLLASLINAIFPGVAVTLAIIYWNRPAPRLVPDYWIVYCAVTVASAIGMWYIPYLRARARSRRAPMVRCMPAHGTSFLRAATTPGRTSCTSAFTHCSRSISSSPFSSGCDDSKATDEAGGPSADDADWTQIQDLSHSTSESVRCPTHPETSPESCALVTSVVRLVAVLQ
jgi:hypothetical protein